MATTEVDSEVATTTVEEEVVVDIKANSLDKDTAVQTKTSKQ